MSPFRWMLGPSFGRRPSCAFLDFGQVVVIIPLRFVNETIKAIVEGLLLSLVYVYQNFKAGPGAISLTIRKWCEAIVAATTIAPNPFVSVTAVTTADIRLIRRLTFTVRLWICLFVVRYVRQRARESLWVRIFWCEFVFRLCLEAHSFHVWYISVSVHFVLLDVVPPSLVLNDLGHWYSSGQEGNSASRHVVGDMWLCQAFIYC